ncbi:hypothetical protein [Enteractinococcus coprophilus]|uniref:Uncharacterized protein n=1 Tax=Enteractinococcus coprophilus TaxID=1027633 RepID=A0A543AK01_9MICC|nr:hypothetical protein [Enteractinococcus coprophilus]TQL72900.1 hypothetical protein FB556_1573 [Enteractinococcus coprophilus]
MSQPWELDHPVPENDRDRARRRRKQFGVSVIALLVVFGMIGTTVLSLL